MKKFFAILGIMGMLISPLAVNVQQGVAADKSWPKNPPSVSAASAIVIDAKSGMILYQKNMNQKRYPASITKIMTTLLALENSSPSETVTYSKTAVLGLEQGASNIGLQVGEKLTMEQSLYAVMLPSANEACNGVAEHISGSVKNFVNEMNIRAKSLGCKNTHFANPNGLWLENHYTTAYDMSLIMREAMKNETFRAIAKTKRYDIPKTNKSKKRYLMHHHQMVCPLNYPQYGYKYCIGGKTGYTSKSCATLVTAAKKGDMELICVVMKTKSAVQGEPNIYTDTIKLFNYCFENYSQYNLSSTNMGVLEKDALFTSFSPFYDLTNSTLTFDGVGSVILPNGVALNRATTKYKYYDAPILKNGKRYIGRVTYYYRGKEAGGADVLYTETSSPTLKDSINMKEWFQEAVETANTPAFPWKTVLLLVLISALGAAIIAGVLYKGYDILRKNKGKRYLNKTKVKNGHFSDLFSRKK